MTLEEIRDKKLGAVINTKTKNEALLLVKTLGVDESRFYDETDFIDVWDAFKENTCYRVVDGKVDMSDCVKYYQSIHEKIYEFSDLFATGGVVSIHDLPTSEWYNPVNISLYKQMEQTKDLVMDFMKGKHIEFKNGNYILVKDEEEKKMPTKFTFYVKEGTRPDKKCNGLIPTMTTTVVDASGKKATVTCDKADYSERQGVLEAIAQMACGGNFDKEYDKAVKKNKLIELHDRTCTYCGKVFDTVEEREAEEAWHVECRKARHDRYLLRKRAKEIAFEEQAQKLAKEIIAEDNKK